MHGVKEENILSLLLLWVGYLNGAPTVLNYVQVCLIWNIQCFVIFVKSKKLKIYLP